MTTGSDETASFLFLSPKEMLIDLPVCTTALAILPMFEVHEEARPEGMGISRDSEHDDEICSSAMDTTDRGERDVLLWFGVTSGVLLADDAV
jgi:hypothetical protein